MTSDSELEDSIRNTLNKLNFLRKSLEGIQTNLGPSRLQWGDFLDKISYLPFDMVSKSISTRLCNYVAYPYCIPPNNGQFNPTDTSIQNPFNVLNSREAKEVESESNRDIEGIKELLLKQGIQLNENDDDNYIIEKIFQSHQLLIKTSVQYIGDYIKKTKVTERIQTPSLQTQKTNSSSNFMILRAMETGENLPRPPDF